MVNVRQRVLKIVTNQIGNRKHCPHFKFKTKTILIRIIQYIINYDYLIVSIDCAQFQIHYFRTHRRVIYT